MIQKLNFKALCALLLAHLLLRQALTQRLPRSFRTICTMSTDPVHRLSNVLPSIIRLPLPV